jgi:hypothetical protein
MVKPAPGAMIYTIYIFEADGTPAEPIGLHSNTDEHALQASRSILLDGERAEVWLRVRLVGRVEGQPLTLTVPASSAARS